MLDKLAAIVARAATLEERLRGQVLPIQQDASASLIAKRLEAWRKAAARGEDDLFALRLAWDGLDIQAARLALGPVALPQDAALPAWADIIAEVAAEDFTLREAGFIYANAPIAFEEILGRFVMVGRRRLAQSEGYNLLTPQAQISLERALLLQLAAEAEQALFLEFYILRSRQKASARRQTPASLSANPIYSRFVEQMAGAGLLDLFHTYPMLARMLGTTTILWAEASAELLSRLQADHNHIAAVFNSGRELGLVTAIQPGLSDPHHGRRTVATLTFASGLKLVYKPKPLALDSAYGALVSWLNKHGAPQSFYYPAVLDRDAYGWVEFVAQRDCEDLATAHSYYRRSGALLALVYALEATDCHDENIMAWGDQPVLIDTETLVQPYIRVGALGEASGAFARAQDQIEHSVLRTQMLPRWIEHFGGAAAADVSGLGNGAGAGKTPGWVNTNTDAMQREFVDAPPQQRRGPSLNGQALSSADFVEDLVVGFEQTYSFLLGRRAALLAQQSPLRLFSDALARFIFRPTMVYVRLLRQLRQPKYLVDGVEWGIGAELLTRLVLWYEGGLAPQERAPLFWPALAAEQRSLALGDLPFFTVATNGTALNLPDGSAIPRSFNKPGFDLVLERIGALSQNDLMRQVGFIRASFFSYQSGQSEAPQETSQPAAAINDAPILDPAQFMAAAVRIAEDFRQRAVLGTDGSATWIAPQVLGELSVLQLQPLGRDLYDGASGIGLFLAALEAVSGGSGFRDLALGAVQSLREELAGNNPALARLRGIGGAEGLGAVVFVLAQMARLLGEPQLLQDARHAALLITPELIADDTRFDVVAGAAGAILCLLALDPALADPALRQRAVLCGKRLVESRIPAPTGGNAWPTIRGRLMGGFSHGAAGVAYALLRLHEVTGDSELIEAAQDAIAFEAGVFSPEHSNWPNLHAEEQPNFWVAWCHGAAGIGLARIGGLNALDTPAIRADIEVALTTTLGAGVGVNDHLCCGNMGRVDLLLVAAQKLNRPDMTETARAWASAILARAKLNGRFTVASATNIWRPGFFTGTAGIGYELLRLAAPDKLPSVLLWAPSPD